MNSFLSYTSSEAIDKEMDDSREKQLRRFRYCSSKFKKIASKKQKIAKSLIDLTNTFISEDFDTLKSSSCIRVPYTKSQNIKIVSRNAQLYVQGFRLNTLKMFLDTLVKVHQNHLLLRKKMAI